MKSDDLLLAAKGVQFKARAVETKFERLAKTPLPAIARRRDGRLFVLAKVVEDKVLIQYLLAPPQEYQDEIHNLRKHSLKSFSFWVSNAP